MRALFVLLGLLISLPPVAAGPLGTLRDVDAEILLWKTFPMRNEIESRPWEVTFDVTDRGFEILHGDPDGVEIRSLGGFRVAEESKMRALRDALTRKGAPWVPSPGDVEYECARQPSGFPTVTISDRFHSSYYDTTEQVARTASDVRVESEESKTLSLLIVNSWMYDCEKKELWLEQYVRVEYQRSTVKSVTMGVVTDVSMDDYEEQAFSYRFAETPAPFP